MEFVEEINSKNSSDNEIDVPEMVEQATVEQQKTSPARRKKRSTNGMTKERSPHSMAKTALFDVIKSMYSTYESLETNVPPPDACEGCHSPFKNGADNPYIDTKVPKKYLVMQYAAKEGLPHPLKVVWTESLKEGFRSYVKESIDTAGYVCLCPKCHDKKMKDKPYSILPYKKKDMLTQFYNSFEGENSPWYQNERDLQIVEPASGVQRHSKATYTCPTTPWIVEILKMTRAYWTSATDDIELRKYKHKNPDILFKRKKANNHVDYELIRYREVLDTLF